MAMLALLCLPLPLWAGLALILLLMFSLLYHLLRDARLSLPTSFKALKTDGQNWSVLTQSGAVLPVYFCHDCVVMPWLIVLNMTQPGNTFTHHLVLMPDSMTFAELRQLRVLLKWKSDTVRNKNQFNQIVK